MLFMCSAFMEGFTVWSGKIVVGVDCEAGESAFAMATEASGRLASF